MQDIAVRIGLGAGRKTEPAQQLGHDAGDLRAAQVAAHGLGPGDPVIPAGALHGVETLVDEHDHGVAVVHLDGAAVFLVGVPGVAGHFTYSGEVGAEKIRQRLDRLGIGRGVPVAVHIRIGGGIAVLVGHQRPDGLEQALGRGVLERKAAALGLRLGAEIALQGALEECSALRHPGYLVVDDQCRRPIDLLHSLHGIAAVVRRPRGPSATLPPRLGPVDAPPVAQASGVQRPGVQRAVGGHFVIGGDHGYGEPVDEWITDPVAVSHPESCKHGEAPGIEELMAPDVGPRRKTHVTDMPGHDHGDLGGAHIADGAYRRGDPVVRQVALVGDLAVLDQQHDGVGVGAILGVDQPRVVRNPADANLRSIHEVGVALDVGRSAVEIVGNRSPPGSDLVVYEPGENLSIVIGHVGEVAVVAISRRSRFGRFRGFHIGDVVIARQRFQGKQAVVKRPLPGAGVKYHDGITRRKVMLCILPERAAFKESTNAVDNSVENTLIEAHMARCCAVSSQIGQKNVKFLFLL